MLTSGFFEKVRDKAAELAVEDYSRKSTSDLQAIVHDTNSPHFLGSIAEQVLEDRGITTHEVDSVTSESSSNDSKELAFRFTGNVGEYFRIWVVNVFLTIVTLGIYSAWAKVRTKRYFYGNTVLDGSPLDYDAKPTAILKGRLIAVAVIAVYLVTINYYPGTEPFFVLAFFILLPWLLVKAFAFRARYSSYRNVRFGFVGTYGGAAAVLLGRGLIAVLTFGLAYPWFVAHRIGFFVRHTRFGTTPLSFEIDWGDFFVAYVGASLLALAITIPGFAAITSVMGNLDVSGEAEQGSIAGVVALLNLGVVGIVYLVFNGYLKAAVTNIVFQHTAIGDHRFESTLQAAKMIWLYLSNAVAIVCSIGLLVPWARIRIARYRADHLTLLAASDLDGFAAEERQKTAAAGEELSEVLDVDVGI